MHPLSTSVIATGIIIAATVTSICLWTQRGPKALERKLKHSAATSSIIMRQFLVNDTKDDPFVGLYKEVHNRDDSLVDMGAWAVDD